MKKTIAQAFTARRALPANIEAVKKQLLWVHSRLEWLEGHDQNRKVQDLLGSIKSDLIDIEADVQETVDSVLAEPSKGPREEHTAEAPSPEFEQQALRQ